VSNGSHTAVLSEQAVKGLNVRSDGTYVDCTFGRGGHSRIILARLGPTGRLLGIDRDAEAVAAAGAIVDARFCMLHGRFSRLGELAAGAGIEAADGILLDLGVSSPQLDDPARGFSWRFDAPLDMRMDRAGGITAAEWLAQASLLELREVLKNYGEERFAKQIAAAIVAARARGPVRTTRQLAALVAAAIPARAREPHQDPATRAFQALRIHVNQELEELSLALPQCMELLRPAGRLVVISFHSLEDRIVKRFLRGEARPDRLPARLPVRAAEMARPRLALMGRAIRPEAAEVAANPRARSAVMRIAEKAA
jgi:16S rRNA (cytosine1402-N4)-methyltransferase